MSKKKEVFDVSLLTIGAILIIVGFFIDIDALNAVNAIDAATDINMAVQIIIRSHIQAHAAIAIGAFLVGIVAILKILDSKEE